MNNQKLRFRLCVLVMVLGFAMSGCRASCGCPMAKEKEPHRHIENPALSSASILYVDYVYYIV